MTTPINTTDRNVVVKVVDLHKTFGTLEVLKGISLDVHEGDVLTLLGASGSGKTTLLRCINYLEQPTSGETYIDGRPLGFQIDTAGRRTKASQNSINALRMEIGMVFQQFNLWPHMTAFENIIEAPLRVKNLAKSEESHWRRSCWRESNYWIKKMNIRHDSLVDNNNVLQLLEHSP